MKFRIGINQSDVVFDDKRLYGDGVNVAARLEAIAEPGSICVSGKVFDEIRPKIGVEFTDMGEQRLNYLVYLKDRQYASHMRYAILSASLIPFSMVATR
jgi:adenylate cyclase